MAKKTCPKMRSFVASHDCFCITPCGKIYKKHGKKYMEWHECFTPKEILNLLFNAVIRAK